MRAIAVVKYRHDLLKQADHGRFRCANDSYKVLRKTLAIMSAGADNTY